jgi:hypothetical protein
VVIQRRLGFMIRKLITLILLMIILNMGFIFSSYAVSLDYSGKELREIPIVENPDDVIEMDLSNNEINDIDNIIYYKNLEKLFLQRNSIYNISALSELKNLKTLSLNGNLLDDISALESLLSLEKLYLVENNIIDISPLKNLSKLDDLYIHKGNNIKNYEEIESVLSLVSDTDINRDYLDGKNIIDIKSSENDFLYNFFFSYNSGDQLRKMDSMYMLTKNSIISYDYVKLDFQDGKLSFNVDSFKSNEINETISIVNNSDAKILNSIYNYGNYENILRSLTAEDLFRFSGRDGLVIDFEGLDSNNYDKYYKLINDLYGLLDKEGKILLVAIEPGKDIDYSLLLNNCHKLILMAHDYDVKRYYDLNNKNNYLYNPQSSAEMIERDISEIYSKVQAEDMSKILLQINYSISQWKIKNKIFIDNDGINDAVINPNKPNYTLLLKRMNIQENLEDKYRYYDSKSNNPFLFYNENGVNNTIWYEDVLSTNYKIGIAEKYGLGGISVWRLGNIPDHEAYDLNVLQYFRKIMEE